MRSRSTFRRILPSALLLLSVSAHAAPQEPSASPDAAVAVLEKFANQNLQTLSPEWRAIATRSDDLTRAAARAQNGLNRMALELASFPTDEGPLLSAPMPVPEPDGSSICVLALSPSGYPAVRSWLKVAMTPSGGTLGDGLELSAYHESAHCVEALLEASDRKEDLSAESVSSLGDLTQSEAELAAPLSEEAFADIYSLLAFESARGKSLGSMPKLWEGLAELRDQMGEGDHRTSAAILWALNQIQGMRIPLAESSDPFFRINLALALRDGAFQSAGEGF